MFFISDLIGCEVWEAGAATPLGTVRDLQPTGDESPGTPLLVVETPRGELLIPFAQEICTRIDPTARRIDVVLPAGLRDLNP
jgi:ribosomal 30S subunit maturation factor RimM